MIGIGLGLMTRAIAPAHVFSPLDLSPVAWFRGDVGSPSSWTDQSGNGHDAPAGGTAPATTTLGGQPAFDFAGSAYFENTTSSLVTPGSIYTVIAVGVCSAVGAILTLRRSSPYSSSLFFYPGSGLDVYVYSDGSAQAVAVAAADAAVVASPFWAEFAYGGVGTNPVIRINGNVIAHTVEGTQTSESGSTGFQIGKNADNQFHQGKLGEIIVLDRALTSDERTAWQAYVGSYWRL